MKLEKVKVSYPFRWRGRVKYSILKMSAIISVAILKCKKIPIPTYQNSLVLNKPKEQLAFSYHTISQNEEKRINWKISPFDGFFTFDKLGYAGFGDSTINRVNMLNLSKKEVIERACHFIDKVNSIKPKYHTPEDSNDNIKCRKIVVVGQLANDNVSKLRTITDEQLLEVGVLLAKKYEAQLVFRPHPLDSNNYDLYNTDFSPISNLAETDSIVVTHNSGFGILAVASNVKTVFLAKNEFLDREYKFSNIDDVLNFCVEEVDNFEQKNFYNYFGSLLSYRDLSIISKMVKEYI